MTTHTPVLEHNPSETLSVPAHSVNWSRVGWFLGLAFGLTWLVDLTIYLTVGLKNPSTTLFLQFQMMLPAFSAMLLNTFFFSDSPIYYRSNRGASRWFVYYYFLLTGLYLVGVVISLLQPDWTAGIAPLLLIPSVLGLILLIALRVKGGKDTFVKAGMAGGKVSIWFGYGLALVAYFAFQTWLNYAFELGTLVDVRTIAPQMAGLPTVALYAALAFSMIIVGPFLGLIITFGEEYGWRGFLQSELIKLGRIRGILLLGAIWGIWHWPVIWMGYNYPGQPVLGSVLMVIYCVILSYFLAHAVFKSQGVWTASYLHALFNQTLSFFLMVVVVPASMTYSFGAGIYSLVLGGIVVLWLLRDPIWKQPA